MAENPKQAEAAELHQRSVELWLGGRHDEAIAVYRQALGLESDAISLQLRDTLPNSYSDPDATPDAPINLQQQNAFAAYRNTARMSTDDALAWFNVGLTHEKEGRAAEAGQAFVESFKSYHRTHAAKTLQASGKAAVEVCRRVVEIDPRDAKAWINLGAALGQAEQPDEEIDAYCKAIKLAPKYAEAWYNLGVAQARRAARLDEEEMRALREAERAMNLEQLQCLAEEADADGDGRADLILHDPSCATSWSHCWGQWLGCRWRRCCSCCAVAAVAGAVTWQCGWWALAHVCVHVCVLRVGGAGACVWI